MSFLEKIFYIKNAPGKKAKVINILGYKFKIRLKNKYEKVVFPQNAQERIEVITNPETVDFQNKVATIFVGFNSNCLINDKSLDYIKALKKQSDFLVLVYDNPIILDEIEKVKNIVDAVIFQRHEEYDFGSYKRGFLLLDKLKVLDKVDNLLFCNDTISLNKTDDLSDVFSKMKKHDFFGLTIHSNGIRKVDEYSLEWFRYPHVQSFFLGVSERVFTEGWFIEFIENIKKEEEKEDIIINYEMGLSRLMLEHGVPLNSYYPYIENVNPYDIYLNRKADKNTVFIKKQ